MHFKSEHHGSLISTVLALTFAGIFTALFSTMLHAAGATLEIEVSQLARRPVLLFLETENNITSKVQPPRPEHAQIVSTLSQFDPPLQILPVGTTIDIINRDSVLHNTHVFDSSRTLFNVATPKTDTKVQRTLSRPGLFGVRCDLHPAMNAWIAVVSNPYFTIINNPGIYSIKKIKPGRYKIHIQQPEQKEQVFEIELSIAETRKIQLPPG